MDKIKINDAVLSLHRAFNTGDKKYVEFAIRSLQSIVNDECAIVLHRADQYVAPKENKQFLPTGIDWFDNATNGGLRRQELFLLGGVTSIGKTHFLSYIAGHYVLKGLNVLHFNGEDILEDVKEIYACGLDKDDMKRLYFAEVISGSFNEAKIEDAIENLKKENFVPDVIVLDHLDIMSVMNNREDWLAISELTKNIRAIAKKHNVIMLTASQMNFAGGGVAGGGFNGSALGRLYRGKVSKAAHCDVIFLVVDAVGNNYQLEVSKLRGRKRKEQFINLNVNLDEMIIG